VTDLYPLRSLQAGHWFKLICGASFQHLPAIRSLALAYTLAGADCIDVAADPAVIRAAQAGIQAALDLAAANPQEFPNFAGRPWLMVSLNDGEDPHFRKASFDATSCPADCPRPCEAICPAQAIADSGVIRDRCYGCGRCIPLCPIQQIVAQSSVSSPGAIAPLVLHSGVDAVEIHTQVGRLPEFRRLWQAIAPFVTHLKLVAISCSDGAGLLDYLWTVADLITPLPGSLIWQTDGRPMSGDIGAGTTQAAIILGQKVLSAGLPGFVQLAGGTNDSTVPKLRSLGLLSPRWLACAAHVSPTSVPENSASPCRIAGVAYGSYARVLLMPVLDQLAPTQSLEQAPHLLQQAIALAGSLMDPLKRSGQIATPPLPAPSYRC